MIKIIKDVYGDPFVLDYCPKDEYDSVILYGDMELIDAKLKDILEALDFNDMMYIAIDFMDTIDELNELLKDNVIMLKENDGKKFNMKEFPEIYIKLTKKEQIAQLLDYWPNSSVCLHYFVIKENMISGNTDITGADIVISSLFYSEKNFFLKNTKANFYITYKKEYKDKINELLKGEII